MSLPYPAPHRAAAAALRQAFPWLMDELKAVRSALRLATVVRLA